MISIKDGRASAKVTFDKLKSGDTFVTDSGSLYMKTSYVYKDISNRPYNCVYLGGGGDGEGIMINVKDDTLVEPVNIEITVHTASTYYWEDNQWKIS